jgi:sulfur-carrier protein adenylyltransferase/sulfurtransferase
MLPEEINRYSRHISLKEIGLEGQMKLRNSRVLVIGAGGLGCPALLYLAAAGVGTLGIADFDRVEESNLQRQVLYRSSDIGSYKAETARNRLLELNPFISVPVITEKITRKNIGSLIRDFDIILDGTDNFPSRYLINDACVRSGKPLVYGSVFRFEGQVAVFNASESDCNYRDLYPLPPSPGSVPDCSESGVMGVIPGIIGSLQANETIKLITGAGELLRNRLFLINTLSFQTFLLEDPRFEPGDYEEFCNFGGLKSSTVATMKEITVSELKKKIDNNEDFQLIDVREPHEYENANLGGELIPLGSILQNVDKISRDKTVVIHCKSGGRSGSAIAELEKRYGFTNLYNLKGGIVAYAKEIDPSLSI